MTTREELCTLLMQFYIFQTNLLKYSTSAFDYSVPSLRNGTDLNCVNNH